MILPCHPANTGVKPLLIRNEEQLRSQLTYIHRGNCELVSEEETTAAGVPEADAADMLRLKLKFASGTIRESEDLLDTLHNLPVKIKNGVSIHCQALNVFKISYQEESVVVDLNLKPSETYDTRPYPLGFQNITRAYFSVILSGEADGWDPNRPCENADTCC